MEYHPDSNLWTLKYRPQNLDELIGREDFVKEINEVSKKNDIPHMMFAGPDGFGKMTAAILVAKKILGDSFQTNCKIIYASDPLTKEERDESKRQSYVSTSKVGSQAGKSFTWPAFIFMRVKPFVELKPIGDKPFKILIIRDFHTLTKDQQGFRRLMEKYSSTCRMILLTDEISSVIDPILSRCRIFFFHSLNEKNFSDIINNIAQKEELKFKGNVSKALFHVTDGKIGIAIQFLQNMAISEEIISYDNVYKLLENNFDNSLNYILRCIISGKMDLAKNASVKLINDGFSFKEIVSGLSEQIFNLPIFESLKAGLLSLISDIDYDAIDANDDMIQINNLIYQILTKITQIDKMGF